MVASRMGFIGTKSRLATFVISGLLGLGLFGGCGSESGAKEPSHSIEETSRNPASDDHEIGSPGKNEKKEYFDKYILKAVEYLYDNYKMLGYDVNALYTHDLEYGPHGILKATRGTNTMCVAAVLEVMITAMQIYERETGNAKIWDFLPIRSYKGLTINDIKGHIWVNYKFDSHGTADALDKFGMGELTPFEQLRPGAFINFNRHKGNGHAVVFLSFIDKHGNEYSKHNRSVIGFKYFSAQGMKDPATAGFDYRYAIFSKTEDDCPDMPYKKDCGLIFSTKRKLFNAGRMWAPEHWDPSRRAQTMMSFSGKNLPETVLDTKLFDGFEGN